MTPNERAREIVDRICCIYRTVGFAMYDEPRERLIADITSALTIPENHVRDAAGVDRRVLEEFLDDTGGGHAGKYIVVCEPTEEDTK